MSLQSDLLGEIEVHSVEGIQRLLSAGVSAVDAINGMRPIEHLTSGYLRSPRFAECLQALMRAGATIADDAVRAVLLDDDALLTSFIADNKRDVKDERFSMRAAFTSCDGVTLLHLCAEFNSTRCARVLLDAGANVNARASVDERGFGGHTPVFHAVNSIHNFCRPMMELLVTSGAALDVHLQGVTWGADMDWETTVLDVTPISYAQCGLYRQFHRSEADVHANLAFLFSHRYGEALRVRNIPNKYLSK